MIITIKTKSIYICSLERAFKTAILCDVTKIHTGFFISPKVTHVTNNENWGQPGASKKIFTKKSLTNKGGFTFYDRVIERDENKYWKIQLDDFQQYMFGFTMFVGEWKTTELEPNKILVEYTYHLHANNYFFYPFNWLFGKIFWRIYMKRLLKTIKQLAYNKEPYLYE